MGIRNFIFYKGVKFERVENWSHKMHVLHFLFSVYFLFTIIEFRNQIKYSYVKNIRRGAFAQPPPPPR
jgi:hypothetical protein